MNRIAAVLAALALTVATLTAVTAPAQAVTAPTATATVSAPAQAATPPADVQQTTGYTYRTVWVSGATWRGRQATCTNLYRGAPWGDYRLWTGEIVLRCEVPLR